MANYDDRLKDYVDVKERIRLFYERFPDGRLTTYEVMLDDPPEGTHRVVVHAKAYRTPDDPLPGDGWSWMLLPGTTPYTRGSEIENAETSAWGRAIGSLGIGIDKSIASADEVASKSGEVVEGGERLKLLGRIQKSGTLVKGTAAQCKGEWREAPGGWSIGFRFKLAGEDRDIPQAVITGPIGAAAHDFGGLGIGTKVTLKGHLYNVKPEVGRSFYRLVVGEHPHTDFLETDEYRIPSLPAPTGPTETPEAPEGDTEAPSQPLFELTDEEKEAIGAGLPA